MRTISRILLAALISAPAIADAQQSANAYGTAPKASVRVAVGLTMPEMVRFRVVEEAKATWQGTSYTEYLIKYSVATNIRWEVSAEALPHGVTVLAWGGEWRNGTDLDRVVDRGVQTNGTEILVRVRVADGAPINWRNELRIELRKAADPIRVWAAQ